jgi:large subunit ribosomal protein L32
MPTLPSLVCPEATRGAGALWFWLLQKAQAMAVPKRRQSNSRTRKRRSHDAKRPQQLAYCPKCSTAVPQHVVCPNCGYYMGRVMVEPAAK